VPAWAAKDQGGQAARELRGRQSSAAIIHELVHTRDEMVNPL
jgi:hypothetical protein